MTAPTSRARIFVRVGAALLVAIAVGLLVEQLARTAPHDPPDFLVDAAPAPDDPRSEVVTCERTLPEAPPETTDPPGVSPVGRVTSTAVVECPDAFDGQVVFYVGEVVGDVLRRDGGAWTLMNDDEYALEAGPLPSHGELRGYNSGLSVWLEGDLADLVTHAGGPRWRGDVLLVRGVVHRADPADGGGLTIRAFDAEVLAPAAAVGVPVHRGQLVAAVLLSILALGLVATQRLRGRT